MPSTTSFVPASKNDLSIDWLQNSLATSFPDTTITSLTCKRIGEAFGFASQIFRCQWQDKASRRSVVVKLWSTSSKAGIEEILFYEAFSDIGIRIPQCYYSAIDENKATAVLVLEDLSDALQGDCLVQMDLVRAQNVARVLAKMHGTWLEHPRVTEHSWLKEASRWDQRGEWFSSRRTEFLERFKGRIVDFPLQVLNNIELAPEIANDRLTGAPVTLFHDDFHLDNILFERQTEPVILDWSSPARGPSVRNLADLLVFMSPLENFDSVFQCYLDEFNKHSKIPQDAHELEKQLGGVLLQLFSRITCGTARWKPSSARGTELINAGITWAGNAINFWHTRDPELFLFAR